jgi:hypothetical protein
MTRVAIPATSVLLVVIAFIALAGYNRSGEPLVRMTLTEGELPLSGRSTTVDRDPGVELRFAYAPRSEPLDARNWLTDERLRQIGFAFNVLPSAPEAADTYSRALPRIAWVAFEYDGEAWKQIERQRQLAAKEPTPYGGQYVPWSRLVPVDVAPDARTLISRYPQGHLILRASIGLRYLPPDQKGPLVSGYIRDLIPSTVHVPREFRDLLASLPPRERDPRYEVDIAVGRLGTAYVTGLRPR